MDPLAVFLDALRPLLCEHGAKAAYVVGSWARGEADEWSDIDVVIVAESPRPAVERFKDYPPRSLRHPARWTFSCTPPRSSNACEPRSVRF